MYLLQLIKKIIRAMDPLSFSLLDRDPDPGEKKRKKLVISKFGPAPLHFTFEPFSTTSNSSYDYFYNLFKLDPDPY